MKIFTSIYMKKKSKIKVAISQRIIPHYRIPVFKNLADRKGIDLTLFYGSGFKDGSQVNAKKITGFRSIKLFTIMLNYSGIYGSSQLRVWHPFLILHLIYGGFDVIIVEPSTNFYNNISSYIYCKIFRKKFIWHESGTVPKQQRSKFRRLIDPILSIFIKGADSFITYTSYADKSLKRDFNINSKKIFRAQNTVDTSKIVEEFDIFSPLVNSKKKELKLSDFHIALYIGGIEKRKKIHNLITAITNLNKSGVLCKALIVGDGPDKDSLIRELSHEDISNSVFVGKKIKEATLYVLLSDVVVLPSSGGLSVMTAFACKKPFIGSEKIEHGGIKDYVKHGVNGFLVKENNINDLYQKLKIIFTNDNLRNHMSDEAFSTSKKITIKNMVNGIENAINYSIKK